MAWKNRGKLGIGLLDPDLSKNRGGLPDLNPIFVEILSPSRYLAHSHGALMHSAASVELPYYIDG